MSAHANRIAKLRAEMPSLAVDAFLVSARANRVYLSGFSGGSGWLLITQSDAVLATDFRYVEQAAAESPLFRVQRVRAGYGWFAELAGEMGARAVGIEADSVTLAEYRAMLAAVEEAEPSPDVELIETKGVAQSIRAVKDAAELAALERAALIADDALAAVVPRIRPGLTERRVARWLEDEMRDLGAAGPSFDTIVATGANAALPHHRADDTILRRGDSLVIDMGALAGGYCSDLTRTFAVGEPDDKFREIYGIVLRAQRAAIDGAAAGMSGESIDEIARDVISDAGYADEFGHGLGHGVGLDVHERPRVVPTSEDEIADGMAFTIEPGIYIPGWGGVRIEDIVAIENGVARTLTRSPKGLDAATANGDA